MAEALQGLFGLAVLTGAAWALSERRNAVPWRIVGIGLTGQFVLALLLLKVQLVADAFGLLNDALLALVEATRAGTSFVFGYLGGGPAPFEVDPASAGSRFILAFESLPLILVVSALSALLFHWNIMPPVVRVFAGALRRTLKVDGPVGVAVTLNVFMGQTEAPILVKPYLARETRSGLFVIMTAGLATVAGTVMVLYATFLEGIIANPLGQILTASLISAPAAIVVSLIMIPEDPSNRPDQDQTYVHFPSEDGDTAMSVITRGTLDGVQLVINIIAMLIVLIALVTLINMALAQLPDIFGAPVSMQRILGWLLAPLAWLLGIPWSEATTAGALLGTKTILNELIAYVELANLPPDALNPRSRLIMTYALCGFANLGSMGIMIGALTTMVPDRRSEIVALVPRALISGTIATCMTGAIVGLIFL